LARAVEDPQLGGGPLAGRTLVILNAPDFRIGLHAYFFRQLYRLPMPDAWRVLSWAPCSHRFRRTAVDAMEMELLDGELNAPALGGGETINVEGMQARVNETRAHGPTRVTFRFARPLDDPSFVFLMWKNGRLQPVSLPPVGGLLDLPWEAANPL